MLFFGPPGSGKTSGIAITNAITFQGSVLAIDIKGDLYNYVYRNSNRKIIRFAPDAEDALAISCHFNPLASLNTMTLTEQKLFLENMATILIPDEGAAKVLTLLQERGSSFKELRILSFLKTLIHHSPILFMQSYKKCIRLG